MNTLIAESRRAGYDARMSCLPRYFPNGLVPGSQAHDAWEAGWAEANMERNELYAGSPGC